MPKRFIITPYNPVLWSLESREKYGKPASDLPFNLSGLQPGRDEGWQLHHIDRNSFSMIADGKLSVTGSLVEHNILVFKIAAGIKVPQFVRWYRSCIPEQYGLYLFAIDNDTVLKLGSGTSPEDIAAFTGYPVHSVKNPPALAPNDVFAWHFSTGQLRFEYENTPVEPGLTLKTDAAPVPERSGFHASILPLDALRFFAVRPNDRMIISRVRLGGEIVENERGSTLVAQQREHRWTADAETMLENFAVSYIQRAIAWLSIEGVIVPTILTDALRMRQRWFAREISQRELYEAADALLAWGEAQPHPLDRPQDAEGMAMLRLVQQQMKVARKYNADDWLDYWQMCLLAEPVMLARRLAPYLRRDTQFFALGAPDIAAKSRQVVCNYDGWHDALVDDAPGIAAHIHEYQRRASYGVAQLTPLQAPNSYLNNCKLRAPDPDVDLHIRLMQLAPDGYQE